MKKNPKGGVRKAKGRVTLRARPGSHVSADAVKDVGRVFMRLVDQGNGTARALVDAARSPNSPAHRHFEWDNTKAGEKWREEQARQYIKSIEIRVETISPEPIRAFLPVHDGGRYERIERVVEDVDLLQSTIAQAKRELQSWAKRYDQLRKVGEMRGIFEAIETSQAAAE